MNVSALPTYYNHCRRKYLSSQLSTINSCIGTINCLSRGNFSSEIFTIVNMPFREKIDVLTQRGEYCYVNHIEYKYRKTSTIYPLWKTLWKLLKTQCYQQYYQGFTQVYPGINPCIFCCIIFAKHRFGLNYVATRYVTHAPRFSQKS